MAAFFLFHESLNDFLPVSKRNCWICYKFHGKSSVKDAIEAIGIPHPEVDLIFVCNTSVDFGYQLMENDQIEVYPVMPDHKFPGSFSLAEKFLALEKFVLDVHLGKLGKALRLLGIDALMDNNLNDKMIAQLSESNNRVVLTRDVGLLKHKAIKCGYWLRSQQWEEQLNEVVTRFGLRGKFKPFTRCIVCNGNIHTVPKETILHQIPPKSRELFHEFFQCTNCKKVYWKGSHYESMEEWVNKWEHFKTF